MTEREVDPNITEVPEIPEVLTSLLTYVVEEAKTKFEKDGDFLPFTALAVGDTLFLESVEAGSSEQMYAFAKHTVEHVRGASGYALCYDGYLRTNQGERDAIVAEGGVPGALQGETVCLPYDVKDDGTREYYPQIVYMGKAPNFMVFLTDESDPLRAAEAADEEDGAQDAAE